jgi:arsenate reductase
MAESPLRLLFVCIHNSARSQMAEAFANRAGRDAVAAMSAGLEAGMLNPLVVESMREIGVDISGHATRSVRDLLRAGERFDYVITVCDESRAEECPVFPGTAQRLHWNFPDPSSFTGDRNMVLAKIRVVRDAIRVAVEDFIACLPGLEAARG